jgi:hypothetical protein
VHPLYKDGVKVYTVQASHIDRPKMWSGSRSPEGENSAVRAEVVCGLMGVELVRGELVEGCEHLQILLVHAVDQCAAPATDRAVTRPHVVEFNLHLEADATAVTTPAVDRHLFIMHGSAIAAKQTLPTTINASNFAVAPAQHALSRAAKCPCCGGRNASFAHCGDQALTGNFPYKAFPISLGPNILNRRRIHFVAAVPQGVAGDLVKHEEAHDRPVGRDE